MKFSWFLNRRRPEPNLSWMKMTYPVRKISRVSQIKLKYEIKFRLHTEDYRCRLPDAKHPVIKVKMRKSLAQDLLAERRRKFLYA